MKKESDLWKLLKKNTPQIKWTRLESWSSFGTPDLLGYHDTCGFFMCELKLVHDKKIHFSPHQILFHQILSLVQHYKLIIKQLEYLKPTQPELEMVHFHLNY